MRNNRRALRVLIAAAIASAAGCASTPSGPPPSPSGIFVGESLQEVTGKLVNLCMNYKYSVAESSNVHVVCEREASAGRDFLYRAFISGSYAEAARERVRFSLAQLPEGIRVFGSATIEAQMPFGQTKKTTMDDAKTLGEIRNALVSAGAL